jgi:hypothetical protein
MGNDGTAAYKNLGTLGDDPTITLIYTDLNAVPLKHRGIYFAGTGPYYAEFDIILSHTISVHSWVLVKTLGDCTLFNKITPQFTPDETYRQFLRLSVDVTGKLTA